MTIGLPFNKMVSLFVAVLINLICVTHGMTNAHFDSIDTDRNGRISYQELLALFSSNPTIHPSVVQAIATDALKSRDRNGDGYISREEFIGVGASQSNVVLPTDDDPKKEQIAEVMALVGASTTINHPEIPRRSFPFSQHITALETETPLPKAANPTTPSRNTPNSILAEVVSNASNHAALNPANRSDDRITPTTTSQPISSHLLPQVQPVRPQPEKVLPQPVKPKPNATNKRFVSRPEDIPQTRLNSMDESQIQPKSQPQPHIKPRFRPTSIPESDSTVLKKPTIYTLNPCEEDNPPKDCHETKIKERIDDNANDKTNSQLDKHGNSLEPKIPVPKPTTTDLRHNLSLRTRNGVFVPPKPL